MADRDPDTITWQEGWALIESFYGPSPKASPKEAPLGDDTGKLHNLAELSLGRGASEFGAAATDMPPAAGEVAAGDVAAGQGGGGNFVMTDEFPGLLDDIEQFTSDALRDGNAQLMGGVFASPPQASTSQLPSPGMIATPPLPSLPAEYSPERSSAAPAAYKPSPVLPSSSAKSYMQEEMRFEESGHKQPIPEPNFPALAGSGPIFERPNMPVELGGYHPVFGQISPGDQQVGNLAGSPTSHGASVSSYGGFQGSNIAPVSNYGESQIGGPLRSYRGFQMSNGVPLRDIRLQDLRPAAEPFANGSESRRDSLLDQTMGGAMHSPTSNDYQDGNLIRPFKGTKRAHESSPLRGDPPPSAQKATKKPPTKKPKLEAASPENDLSLPDLSSEVQAAPPSATKKFNTPKKPKAGEKNATPKSTRSAKTPASKKPSTKPRLSKLPPGEFDEIFNTTPKTTTPKSTNSASTSKKSKSKPKPRPSNFPPENDDVFGPPPKAEPQSEKLLQAKPKRRTKSTNTDAPVEEEPKKAPRARNSLATKELKLLVGDAVMKDFHNKKISPRKTRAQKDAADKAVPNAGAAAKRRHTGGAGK